MANPLRLTTLNHISIVCRCLKKSMDFYQNVLGFVPIRRPGSLDFEGAWLFNFGFGIHLLQADNPENMSPINDINPKDNHISFQCESMSNVEKRLRDMKIGFVTNRVEEGGIQVDQIFFHDPDGMMIEVCNCDALPVIPIGNGSTNGSCSRVTGFDERRQPYSPRMCPQCIGSSQPSLPLADNLQRIPSVLSSLAK